MRVHLQEIGASFQQAAKKAFVITSLPAFTIVGHIDSFHRSLATNDGK